MLKLILKKPLKKKLVQTLGVILGPPPPPVQTKSEVLYFILTLPL